MSIPKQRARSVKHAVLSGDEQLSPVIDAAGSLGPVSLNIELTGPGSQVSVQGSPGLAFTFAVSVTGKSFTTPVAVAAGAIGNYNATNCAVIKITATNGSGTVTCLAT
jgi:hypothetical protein